MIQILNYGQVSNREIFARVVPEMDVAGIVSEIIRDVRKFGDEALLQYCQRFDRVKLNNLEVSQEEIEEAVAQVDPEFLQILTEAAENIKSFHSHQVRNSFVTQRDGVILGQKVTPIENVGIYVPGGTAAYPSTVLMDTIPAKIAGCSQIVMVTPPSRDGSVNPAILAAAKIAGVDRIFKVGGAQAVAALAYGTQSVPKVDKIVGPGNAYVTAAKKLVFGKVAIDMVAGPSEIMVIADRTAPAEFIAADFLSQAEHGSGLEQSVLVTDSDEVLDAVEKEVMKQKASLPRIATVDRVLEKGAFLIRVNDMAEAAEIANSYAPEHLEIMTEFPEKVARNIRAAGAIFLGPWTPEPAGDFCAGPSHVLPTAGSAKFFRGLGVDSFYRRSSLVRYSEEAIRREAWIIEEFASMEGLDAHGRSGTIRRK